MVHPFISYEQVLLFLQEARVQVLKYIAQLECSHLVFLANASVTDILQSEC